MRPLHCVTHYNVTYLCDCGASGDNVQAPSSLTFGSRSSSSWGGSKGSMDEFSGGSLTPVFKCTHDQEHKRSSLVP